MKMRNITWNNVGTIDCEIEHPVHGWIPFTADPNDVESHGREIFSDCLKLPEVSSQRPNDPRSYPIPPELKAEDMEVLEVVEGQVVLSEDLKSKTLNERQQAEAERLAQETAKKQIETARLNRIQQTNLETATLAQLRAVVKDLVEQLGLTENKK